MTSNAPRDTLSFPFAAAGWTFVIGLVLTSLFSVWTLIQMLGRGAHRDEILLQMAVSVGSGLLSAMLTSVLVGSIGLWQQSRRPARVGQARYAGLVTAMVASALATAVSVLVTGITYAFVPFSTSPTGFLVVPPALGLVHLAVAAGGAVVGTALLVQDGPPAEPAAVRRRATAGSMVFFAVLALGLEITLAVAPVVVLDEIDLPMLSLTRWIGPSVLFVSLALSAGYAWMRHRGEEARARWRGDAGAGLIALPLSWLLGALLSAGIVGLVYGVNDPDLWLFLAMGVVPAALVAYAVLGTAIGAVRMRFARTRRLPASAA
jgi:hypothetical protein